MQSAEPIQKVVVADSHAIVREGIRVQLEKVRNLQVVADAPDGESALKACHDHAPDILLMDLALSRPAGRELLLKIKEYSPATRVIVLCQELKLANAFFCLTNGAVGLMTKHSVGRDFVNATSAAARGYTYIPSDFLADLMAARMNLSKSGNIFCLSHRELEIICFCVQRKSTKDTAEALRISARTVETHKSNIYRKTHCRNLDELTLEFGEMRKPDLSFHH